VEQSASLPGGHGAQPAQHDRVFGRAGSSKQLSTASTSPVSWAATRSPTPCSWAGRRPVGEGLGHRASDVTVKIATVFDPKTLTNAWRPSGPVTTFSGVSPTTTGHARSRWSAVPKMLTVAFPSVT
jgi:hypothetical protein